MIELIINAVKLAFSEDARKSASGLMEFIRRSPNWQKDICTLEAKVNTDSQEHAYLLGELACEKMANLSFSQNSVASFANVYRELTANAFEHGCRSKPLLQITIIIEITRHYIALSVSNPKGFKFDLQAQLDEQKSILKDNPVSLRGRGLLTSYENADLLTGTHSGEGIKAVFYNPAVELQGNVIDDVFVIHVLSGSGNPSLNRRIDSLAESHREYNLIVDLAPQTGEGTKLPQTALVSLGKPLSEPEQSFRKRQFDTSRVTHSITLQRRFVARGKRVAYLFRDSLFKSSSGILPASLWTSTVEGALKLLGKTQLRSEVEKSISKLPTRELEPRPDDLLETAMCFNCGKCGRKIWVAVTRSGQKMQCPHCGEPNTIP